MHEESSEPSSQCVERIPFPTHLVLFAVRSDDSVTQDVHVDWVAVTVRADPSRLGTAIRLPPRFQNRSQLIPEGYDPVLPRLGCRLLFAVDISLANGERRT